MGAEPAVPLGGPHPRPSPGVGVLPTGTLQSGSEPPVVTVVTVVTQKLAEVILKKQQAALERTSNAPTAALPYRSLEPLEPEGPSPAMLSTFLSPVPSTSLDTPEHFPLRKTGMAWDVPVCLMALGMSPCPSRPWDCPRVPLGRWRVRCLNSRPSSKLGPGTQFGTRMPSLGLGCPIWDWDAQFGTRMPNLGPG
uniref:Uncharacterized protein n=1 Tax=Zonotrichia albicollis TaxID=44394 RepID=A0A8D2M5J2_ZONAL